MEPTPERCAQLRAHKALPRRRVISEVHEEDSKFRVAPASASNSRLKDAAITSWIASSSPTLANTPQNLPPTPPSLPHDQNESSLHEATSEILHNNTHTDQLVETFPVSANQNTPPTPELTPPRINASRLPRLSPATLRFPSSTSQADSFKTAQEYASSEAETRYKSSPDPYQDTHTENLANTPPAALGQPRNVGLGLGLDLDERKSSSTMRTLRALQSPQVQYTGIDDQPPTVGEDPFVVQETAAVQQMSVGALGHARSLSPINANESTVPDDFQISLDRAFLLHERIDRGRRGLRIKDEIDLEVDDDASLASNKSKVNSPDSVNREDKRMSQLSAGSSAVVEVYIRDTPKRRRQKLRHSSKNTSLREAGSPISGSNRSSLVSNDARPRLHHKVAMNSANRNRTSMNSDSGISMGFDMAHKEEGNILAETPHKRSSLKSPSRERHAGRQPTVESKPAATSRPGTAPDMQARKIAESTLHHRSASDSGSHQPKGKDRGRELQRSRVVVPQRRSSLSAPTSRNRSSAIPNALDTPLDQKQPKPSDDKRVSDAKEVPEILINRDSDSEDGSKGLRLRPSLTRTPFSGISATSIHSSTPGPVELSEATAISIYPHNNKSLLVVQHTSKAGASETQTSAHFTNNVTVELRQPSTRAPSAPAPKPIANAILDSPRIPQARPAVMLIPPTPANAPPQEEEDSETTSRKSRSSNFGPLSSLKRAFSARRHSDIVLSPLSRLAVGSASIPLRRRIKIENGSNALSPFWRPRGFWDDFSDSESEPDEELHYVRNTLGLPQPRVISGPTALVRRISSLKRRKRVFNEDESRPAGRRASLPIMRLKTRDSKSGSTRGFSNMFSEAHDFSNPITNIYDSFMKKKAERKEARQEKDRDKFKRSIVPVVPPRSMSAFD